MPGLVSVNAIRLQPTSGPLSRCWIAAGNVAQTGSNGRSPAKALVGHRTQPGRGETWCAPRTHSLSTRTILSVPKNVNANLTIGRINGSKSLPTLGKELSRNFEIVTRRAWFKLCEAKVTLLPVNTCDHIRRYSINIKAFRPDGLRPTVRKCYPGLNQATRRAWQSVNAVSMATRAG
jgi:hypothetical protein